MGIRRTKAEQEAVSIMGLAFASCALVLLLEANHHSSMYKYKDVWTKPTKTTMSTQWALSAQLEIVHRVHRANRALLIYTDSIVVRGICHIVQSSANTHPASCTLLVLLIWFILSICDL